MNEWINLYWWCISWKQKPMFVYRLDLRVLWFLLRPSCWWNSSSAWKKVVPATGSSVDSSAPVHRWRWPRQTAHLKQAINIRHGEGQPPTMAVSLTTQNNKFLFNIKTDRPQNDYNYSMNRLGMLIIFSSKTKNWFYFFGNRFSIFFPIFGQEII